MKLKQSSHSLTSQVSDGDMTLLTELTEINIRISLWYEAESDAIILLSRSEDINLGEKVCIYHHGLHKSFQKISTILKLSTPDGLSESHDAIAAALEANVADRRSPLVPISTGP